MQKFSLIIASLLSVVALCISCSSTPDKTDNSSLTVCQFNMRYAVKNDGHIIKREICKPPLYGVNFSDNFGYTGRSVIKYPTTSAKIKKMNLIDWEI